MNCVHYCLRLIIISLLIHNISTNEGVYEVSTANAKPGCVCDETTICIRKCCKLNYGIQDAIENCTWYGKSHFEVNVTTDEQPSDVCFNYGIMECANNFFRLEPEMNAEDSFVIEGSVLKTPAIGLSYGIDQFCMEDFEDIGVSAYVCIIGESVDSGQYYAFGMLISVPFLIITFIVHALLPVKTMHTKCLMGFVLSLACAYICLTAIQFYAGSNMAICLMIGMFCVANFIASFIWTNVMSFDIWLTFSGIGGFGRSKKAERKRFLLYFSYTYGISLILILIIVGINYGASETAWYHPLFGYDKCWFRDDMAILLYFYGPLAVIIAVNIILFTLTTLTIKKTQKDTKVLRQGDNKSTDDDKQRFKLYLKLLLAMGGNWSLEVLSWAWGWQIGNVPKFLNYIIDLCNVFYGVLIFFMFTLKKTNWIQLQKRFPKLRQIKMPTCNKRTQKTEEIALS